MFDFPVETAIAKLNALLQHNGPDSALGVELVVVMKILKLESGLSDCPLLYNYDVYTPLATAPQVISLWEKMDRFDIEVELVCKTLK